LLSHYDAKKLVVTGAVALAVSPSSDFAPPLATATAISMFYGALASTSLLSSN
jgi:hypothetical protein